jgi:D-alanyl-D-alanine carboxypeptidase (penicillin-binding protein 5/6)
MKNLSLKVQLAILASIFLVQCADRPAPLPAYGYRQGPGISNPNYAVPAAPIYQLASYQRLPNTPPAGLMPAAPGAATMPIARQPTPYFGAQPHLMFVSPSNVGAGAPAIRAESFILVNADNGRVLAAKNADTRRGAASTQKILTALIVAEAGDLDRKIRVLASDVVVEPSKLGVKPGEVYTRRDLLIAFLVKSSNDVANVLARDNAGSTQAFAEKMTAKARALGAVNSRFANAHGLTASGQYSTARDLARIAWVAYQNPVIRDAVRRKYYTFTFNNGRRITLKNTNDLLGSMPECNGMKTGYTVAAGRCLMSTARSGGRDVILVQLGTRTKYIWNDGAAMMRWGFRR